jgi:hypothetical protein
MAKYEVVAEYDDPKEIPFKSNCVYCLAPVSSDMHVRVEEQSAIRSLSYEQSFFPTLFLFIVYCFILDPFVTPRSPSFLALLLAVVTWSCLRSVLKRLLGKSFRYAEVHACPTCFAKLRKNEKVHLAYFGAIFSCFLIFVVLSLAYSWDELESSKFVAAIVTIWAWSIQG